MNPYQRQTTYGQWGKFPQNHISASVLKTHAISLFIICFRSSLWLLTWLPSWMPKYTPLVHIYSEVMHTHFDMANCMSTWLTKSFTTNHIIYTYEYIIASYTLWAHRELTCGKVNTTMITRLFNLFSKTFRNVVKGHFNLLCMPRRSAFQIECIVQYFCICYWKWNNFKTCFKKYEKFFNKSVMSTTLKHKRAQRNTRNYISILYKRLSHEMILRGTTWRNNGSSTRNGSRFEHDNRLLSGEY